MKSKRGDNPPHIQSCAHCPYLKFNYGEKCSPYFETDSPICGFTGQPLKNIDSIPSWCPFLKKEVNNE